VTPNEPDSESAVKVSPANARARHAETLGLVALLLRPEGNAATPKWWPPLYGTVVARMVQRVARAAQFVQHLLILMGYVFWCALLFSADSRHRLNRRGPRLFRTYKLAQQSDAFSRAFAVS
jgi:hypothetical protein